MTLNLFSFLVITGLSLTLVLAVFFFITPRGSKNENRLLSALLLTFGLQILYSYMTSSYGFQYFLAGHKAVFLIRQTSFFSGPLVYLYIASMMKKKEIADPRNLLHLIPFVCMMAFLPFFYHDRSIFIIWESKIDLYSTILILASNFIYIVLAVVTMRPLRISLRRLFTGMAETPYEGWLQILLLGYIVIWILNLNSFAIWMIAKRPSWCAYTVSIYALAFFLFVNLLMLLLLVKPEIYYILIKYKYDKLEDSEKEDYLQKLNRFMETNKPWLNPEISLESLARESGIPPRILSRIINETYGKNFRNWILDFRISESMKILADRKARNLTILEVLYQVGFNSKSAFNYQFKLFTNLTPQEYRSKFRNESS